MSRPCYSDATTALQSVDRRPGPACWTCGTTLALEIVGSWGVAAPPSSLGYQERGTDCGSPVTPRGAATLLNPLSLKYFQHLPIRGAFSPGDGARQLPRDDRKKMTSWGRGNGAVGCVAKSAVTLYVVPTPPTLEPGNAGGSPPRRVRLRPPVSDGPGPRVSAARDRPRGLRRAPDRDRAPGRGLAGRQPRWRSDGRDTPVPGHRPAGCVASSVARRAGGLRRA